MRRSRSVCDRIVATTDFREARHVVLYAARAGEVDPGLVGHAIAARVSCGSYFPRVEGDGLVFRRAVASDLVPGRFGIPEPPATADALDPGAPGVLVLVPGLAFDGLGTRLGTGKGYYDRALPMYPGARRYGLSLDELVLDRLPRDTWDVPMHAVVTPNNLFVVGGDVGAYPGDSSWR